MALLQKSEAWLQIPDNDQSTLHSVRFINLFCVSIVGTYVTQLLSSELNFLALSKDFYYSTLNWIMKFIDLFNEINGWNAPKIWFGVKIFWVQNFSHFCEKMNYQNLAKSYLWAWIFISEIFIVYSRKIVNFIWLTV